MVTTEPAAGALQDRRCFHQVARMLRYIATATTFLGVDADMRQSVDSQGTRSNKSCFAVIT